jgi:hypothetical protein
MQVAPSINLAKISKTTMKKHHANNMPEDGVID